MGGIFVDIINFTAISWSVARVFDIVIIWNCVPWLFSKEIILFIAAHGLNDYMPSAVGNSLGAISQTK